MGKRPEGSSLDRIDNSKGYFKNNCQWTDGSHQCANRTLFENNTSGYIGVRKHGDKWRAQVDWEGKTYRLGHYYDPVEAAIVRDSFILDNGLPHTLNFKEDTQVLEIK
jgi:hypothetical protein